jgi:hypothetical protein
MQLADVEAILGPPNIGRTPAIGYLDLCVAMLKEEFAAFEAADEAYQWHDNGGTSSSDSGLVAPSHSSDTIRHRGTSSSTDYECGCGFDVGLARRSPILIIQTNSPGSF